MSETLNLDHEKLKLFFINHLDKIYCAKSHLVERLPEMQLQINFDDLRFAIEETLEDVARQIERMDEIYLLLGAEKSIENCNGIIEMIEDSFSVIHQQQIEPLFRDLSILFYMQNIESIEMASFQLLQMVAGKLQNDRVTQLLVENFDEAKSDRILFLLIAAKFINN